MHVCAQGDQPLSMLYFMEKGISIDSRDLSGKTPTHHAAFTGNELFVVYASAFGAEINARDNEGKTPLILSCKSYVDHKNIECLKKLLLGGSDKCLQDS